MGRNVPKRITDAMHVPQRLLYSRKESAHLLGISTQTLDSLMDEGALPFVQMSNRRCVSHDAIQEFIARGGRPGRIRDVRAWDIKQAERAAVKNESDTAL